MDNEREEYLRSFIQAWRDELGDVLTADEARAEFTRVASLYRVLGEKIMEQTNSRDEDGEI